MENKFLLYIITILIDLYLINLKEKKKLNKFDKLYCSILLLVHLIFLFSLYVENRYLLDICHIIMAISVTISIFLKNRELVKLVIYFIILLNFMWIIFDKCILDEPNKDLISSILPIDYKLTSILLVIFLIYFKL